MSLSIYFPSMFSRLEKKTYSHDSGFIPFFKTRGNFDSSIDRILSKQYGGLRWQYAYEIKQVTSPCRLILLKIKTAILILVFVPILFCSFIFGLVTAGVFWPPAIRRFILFVPPVSHDHSNQTSNSEGGRRKVPRPAQSQMLRRSRF